MLAFVIPVRHPESAGSFERVLEFLADALRSVRRQTDPNFEVYVVVNRGVRPPGTFPDVEFIEVDFPSPGPIHGHADVYFDKGCRLAVGTAAAQEAGVSHIMYVDADDWVSRRLSALVSSTLDPSSGYFFREGLIYSQRFKILSEQERFWTLCGTSHILPAGMLELPASVDVGSSQAEIVAAVDSWRLRRIFGNHNDYLDYAAANGFRLSPLPWIGAVWRADTRENTSRIWERAGRWGPIWGWPPGPRDREEFGVPLESRSVLATCNLAYWRVRNLAGRAVRAAVPGFGREAERPLVGSGSGDRP